MKNFLYFELVVLLLIHSGYGSLRLSLRLHLRPRRRLHRRPHARRQFCHRHRPLLRLQLRRLRWRSFRNSIKVTIKRSSFTCILFKMPLSNWKFVCFIFMVIHHPTRFQQNRFSEFSFSIFRKFEYHFSHSMGRIDPKIESVLYKYYHNFNDISKLHWNPMKNTFCVAKRKNIVYISMYTVRTHAYTYILICNIANSCSGDYET